MTIDDCISHRGAENAEKRSFVKKKIISLKGAGDAARKGIAFAMVWDELLYIPA